MYSRLTQGHAKERQGGTDLWASLKLSVSTAIQYRLCFYWPNSIITSGRVVGHTDLFIIAVSEFDLCYCSSCCCSYACCYFNHDFTDTDAMSAWQKKSIICQKHWKDWESHIHKFSLWHYGTFWPMSHTANKIWCSYFTKKRHRASIIHK